MKSENKREDEFKILNDSRSDLTLRQFHEDWEYAACVELQQHAWGEGFEECVPVGILKISQKIGGITAGAFDADGKLVGFVYGLTGVKEGHLVHWSDMLAVREEVRDLGIGRRLKLYQRDMMLELGVETIYWTYDPLVARNAHLNINRFGAEIDEYVLDMYGDDLGSTLSRGIGTDRFIVAWHISEERVRRIISGGIHIDTNEFAQLPVVNTVIREDGSPFPIQGELIIKPSVRIEVPFDILDIQNKSLDSAGLWRTNTRRVFTFYMDRDYKVNAFYRDLKSDRCFYVLTKPSEGCHSGYL